MTPAKGPARGAPCRAAAVITGLGCVGPAGVGAEPLREALRRGEPLGSIESFASRGGGTRSLRVARIPAFDREAWLAPRVLRRMSEVSQVWAVACLAARRDAGLSGEAAAAHAPERRGTWLGTGFGCTRTSWEYLESMARDGAGLANPFLFAESVANAPAGHSAIALDARGANLTMTCGDASALVALDQAARAVQDGRADVAWCGGVEILSEPLLTVIAGLGGVPFVGEGAVCLVIESAESARRRGARIYAEVAATALGSDPAAPATDWGGDPAPIASVIRKVLSKMGTSGDAGAAPRVRPHAPGRAAADLAERSAIAEVVRQPPLDPASRVLGSLTACGGFNLAASLVDERRDAAASCELIHAMSWGGTLAAAALRF